MTSGGPAGFNLPSLRLARGSRGEYGQKRCIASTPTAAHGEPPLPHPAAHPRSRRHLPVRAVPAAGSRRPAATLYDGWGSRTATRRTSPGKPVPRLDGRAAPSGAARRTRSTPAAARDREDGRPAMRTASSRRGVPPRGSSQARCYFLAWLALIAASMLLAAARRERGAAHTARQLAHFHGKSRISGPGRSNVDCEMRTFRYDIDKKLINILTSRQ